MSIKNTSEPGSALIMIKYPNKNSFTKHLQRNTMTLLISHLNYMLCFFSQVPHQ